MKNQIKRICLCLITIVSIFSACTKHNSVSETSIRRTNDEIKAIVSKLGEQHNVALNKILLGLKKAYTQQVSVNSMGARKDFFNPNDQEPYDFIINTATQEAMTNFAYLQPSETYAIDYIKTYVFGYEYGQIQPDYNHRWNEDNIMSSQLENLMWQVKDAIQNSVDRYQTLDALQTLLDNNLNVIADEDERIAFAGAIEIGKSSCNYWYDNVDQWIDLYPDFGNYALPQLKTNRIYK
jgi:hypothetical protein